jgi:hypothetical protein
MYSKTAIALTAASLAIVTSNFMPSAQVSEQGYFSVNYSACYEDPTGAECQKAQVRSSQQSMAAPVCVIIEARTDVTPQLTCGGGVWARQGNGQ